MLHHPKVALSGFSGILYLLQNNLKKNNFSSQINNRAGCFLFSIIFSAKFYSVVAFYTQRAYFSSVYSSQERSFTLNFFFTKGKNWC